MRFSAALVASASFAIWSIPLFAQASIQSDERVVSVPAHEDELIHFNTSPGAVQILLFPVGEQIASIVLSDPGAYVVDVARRGDSLALKATRGDALAIMSIRTDRRTYEFELVAQSSGTVPAVVRLDDGPFSRNEADAPTNMRFDPNTARFAYQLKGAASVRPSAISDDGERTYIQWAEDQAMPATFALTARGKEELVNGYVRFGVFMIDRVFESLVFRLDRNEAFAKRETAGKKRRESR